MAAADMPLLCMPELVPLHAVVCAGQIMPGAALSCPLHV